MGVGVGINVGEWREVVWANADGGQNGEKVNSIRFRLRVGRE